MMRLRRMIRMIRVRRVIRMQMHISMLRICLSMRHVLEARCLTRLEMLPLHTGRPLPLDGYFGPLQA